LAIGQRDDRAECGISGRFLWQAGKVTNDLSIDVDQIRSALARVLNVVERDLGRQLHLEGDPYWSLPVAAAFDLSKSDPSLTIGQLSDDVDAIRELLDDEGREIVAVWHELAHIVGVLRAVERIALP
jgi:hypothetical protein